MTMYFSCNLCITLSSRDQNNIKSDLLLSHLVAYLVARTMDIGPAAAAAQHNARTLSPDPQSTGAAITMDGGVADTTRGNIVVTHQAVPRQSVGEEKARY